MAINPISNVSASNAPDSTQKNSRLDQDEFIKLFLAQLQFQDPMEPIDNREFLAQMAQFTNLEQTRVIGENTKMTEFNLLTTNAAGMLGKKVFIATANDEMPGTVSAVHFTKEGPLLDITMDGGPIMPKIPMSQIVRIVADK